MIVGHRTVSAVDGDVLQGLHYGAGDRMLEDFLLGHKAHKAAVLPKW